MKRISSLILILCLFCFALKSCSLDLYNEEEPDFAFDKLTLSYFEKFSNEGRQFVVYLETVEFFPCNNFGIRTMVLDTDSLLRIEAHNIDVPSICISEIGPATRKIILQNSELPSKPVVIYVNNHRHEFRFIKSEQKIVLENLNYFNEFLIIPNDTLFRIPDNFVWGYYQASSQTDKSQLDSLLTGFYSAGASEFQLNDGHYHYFEVEDGVFAFPQHPAGALVGFGFKKVGADLSMLNDIAIARLPGIRLTLFDTFGNTFSSDL